MRAFDRVDDLLHTRALGEVALIRLTAVGVLALRDEVFQDADDARQPRLHDPQADVDRRRAIALERADLDRRVARVRTCETAWPRRVDPLGVLLPAIEDVRLTNEAVLNEVVHVLHRRRVPERQPDLWLEPLRSRGGVRAP